MLISGEANFFEKIIKEYSDFLDELLLNHFYMNELLFIAKVNRYFYNLVQKKPDKGNSHFQQRKLMHDLIKLIHKFGLEISLEHQQRLNKLPSKYIKALVLEAKSKKLLSSLEASTEEIYNRLALQFMLRRLGIANTVTIESLMMNFNSFAEALQFCAETYHIMSQSPAASRTEGQNLARKLNFAHYRIKFISETLSHYDHYTYYLMKQEVTEWQLFLQQSHIQPQ